MIFLRAIRRTIEKIVYSFESINIIRLSKNCILPKSTILQRARLSGNIILKGSNRIQGGVKIIADSMVEIGRFTSINGPNTDIISSLFPIKIGAFCSIARNVAIQEANHFTDKAATYYILKNIFDEKNNNRTSKGEIWIGNDVWVGTQCVILSGSTIGDGAIIAANSVVSGNIPPFAIAAGSPAKVLKYRFEDEVITTLMQVRWWDWEIDKIKRNKLFFTENLTSSFLKNYVIKD